MRMVVSADEKVKEVSLIKREVSGGDRLAVKISLALEPNANIDLPPNNWRFSQTNSLVFLAA